MAAPATLPGTGSKLRRLVPSRLHARRAERVIASWSFPAHIWGTVARRYPQVRDESVRAEVDHGLRDWLICCAWRGRRSLGMPSRLVDEAWHALILDTVAYMELCRAAFGAYLHHFPEGSVDAARWPGLVNTVWTWDRSQAGRDEDSLLWDLDERHDVDDPWGISEFDLARIRARGYADGGAFIAGDGAFGDCPPDAGANGCGGGAGCSGGGGCGGGGGT
jgi:hypothetical protein